MPPDGYESVTLPSDLVQQIDDIADEMHPNSRVVVLRGLIAEYKESDANDDSIDYAEIERRCKRAVGAELEGRLR
jgi:metal-responsive CopG/Arc/MetJ family transcriptional regulator